MLLIAQVKECPNHCDLCDKFVSILECRENCSLLNSGAQQRRKGRSKQDQSCLSPRADQREVVMDQLAEGVYKLYPCSILDRVDITEIRKTHIIITHLRAFRNKDVVLLIEKAPMARWLTSHVPLEESMESTAGTLTLLRDDKLCRNCGACSRLLPDYIRKYRGKLLISRYRYNTSDEVQNAVRDVIDACPSIAISLRADFVYLSPVERDELHSTTPQPNNSQDYNPQ